MWKQSRKQAFGIVDKRFAGHPSDQESKQYLIVVDCFASRTATSGQKQALTSSLLMMELACILKPDQSRSRAPTPALFSQPQSEALWPMPLRGRKNVQEVPRCLTSI